MTVRVRRDHAIEGLGAIGDSPFGLRLNDFNMVDSIEPTSPARGRNGLQVGDVVVSIDGESVAGLYLEDVLEVVGKSKPRYAVGVIRRKGSIPLSGAVRVAPCNRCCNGSTRASALELVLPRRSPRAARGPPLRIGTC